MSDFSTRLGFIVQLAAIGMGTGRALPTAAAVVGLISVTIGGLALARAGTSNARVIVALMMGLISAVIGGLHAANAVGGFGTGNGLAGAIVAAVVGLIGMSLAALALVRSRRRRRAN